MRTGDLTHGERVLVERRRARETQRAAAKRHRVSLYRYRSWEADESDCDAAPKVRLGRLRPHEICFLLRRRAGIPLHQLAEALGVSRWWLTQMEYGLAPSDRIREHWHGVAAA